MHSLYALLEQDEETDTAGWFGLLCFLPWSELQAWQEFLEISVWGYSLTKTLMLSVRTSLEWLLLPWHGEEP